MSDVITIVEGLDLVVSLADGHVHPGDLDGARTTATEARSRAGHLGSTMVLALVGGTGSGKSSLLNALADEQIASTSPVRPHTTEPLAWIPLGAEPSLRPLLDRLGIERRITHEMFAELAILDMTDLDSISPQHRDRVERLMPEVDVVVWVLDPVKYSDPTLHNEFIAPLAGSVDRMVFVLNKSDRLDEAGLAGVVRDLERLLADDGIADPMIFEVAADPPGTDPRGVEALAAHLAVRLDEKRIHVGKIIDDVRRAAHAVAVAAGVGRSGSLDFEERWRSVREAIVTDVVTGGGAAAFEEGLRLVEGFISRLSTEAGGVFGQRIRQTFGEEMIESALAGALGGLENSSNPSAHLHDGLQARLGAPLRTLLWKRASLAAVVAGLAVDASMVDESLGRAAT